MDDFKISPIRNGTAIDHITVGQAINVLKILNVNENTICSAASVGMHVRSKKTGGWKEHGRMCCTSAINQRNVAISNANFSISE